MQIRQLGAAILDFRLAIGKDLDLPENYKPAPNHPIQYRQEFTDLCFAVDDFDDNRKVLQEA